MRIDTYRLTAGDEVRIISALRRLTLAKVTDPGELEVAGAHAIGCTLYSLREIERAWIQQVAAELVWKASAE